MKSLNPLARYRDTSPEVVQFFGSVGDHTCGVFTVPSPLDRADMKIIASARDGWDHVSVTRADRCPVWLEMDYIARLFFKPDEAAMELHVPPSMHIDIHPFALHLWRPHGVEIPLPPQAMV